MTILKKTPLYDQHLQLNALMAPFAGYEMPIHYPGSGGMLKEHLAVRQSAGIFDVSHMGEFLVEGPDACAFLSFVTTRPVFNLPSFKAQYCLLLKQDGSIVDDIIVYKFSDQKFLIVVNASNLEKDWDHIRSFVSGFKVTLTNQSDDFALLSIQGPKATDFITSHFKEALQLKYYEFMELNGHLIARTGYTGEDGFEIFLAPSIAPRVWDQAVKAGIIPIGLGARDTLRLEVGFPLYGHELTEDFRPQETLSSFAVAKEGDFVGSAATKLSPRYRPVGLLGQSPKPFRQGEKLFLNQTEVGFVTSGSTSPILRQGMALALINTDLVAPLYSGVFSLESGGKPREASVHSLPLVETFRAKSKIKKSL